VFDRFLERITGGDQALAGYLQRAIGYSITGVTGEQVLFFAHGHGANGKSTLMNAMRSALGDYWAALAPDTLVNDGSAQHPTNIADLVGKRFVVSQEVEEGRRIDEQLVKQLTGGDRLKARFMRQDFFEFTATHKIWLCANHKPFVRGTDHAIWRRIKLIPFTVTIPDSERDTHLDAKLAAEAPGILAWAVQGCLWWQRDGLAAPDSVEGATAGYRVEQDVLGRFLEDRCFVEPGNEQMRCAAASLRGSYVEWCDEQGERPMSARALAPHLRERGLVSVKDRRSHTWWLGLAVNDAARLQPNEGDLDA
jgi:putative DNA primase/helicase